MAKQLKKIFYVEDDIDIATVAKMTMEELGGFELKHSLSGTEALTQMPEFSPQLVLMDMMMPEIDGLEVMKRMRQSDELKNIPVIFMTAKAQVHEQESYISAGALGVILKPFDPVTLCDSINNLWNKINDN